MANLRNDGEQVRVRVPPIEIDAFLFQRLNDYVEREQQAAVAAGGRRLDVSRQKVIERAVQEYLERQERVGKSGFIKKQ